MAYFGKRNLTFNWETPSGFKINFGLGKETTQRAGLKFIREGSGVQINIINKEKIDVKKSVVALMPNFIHSLDASNIHEITNVLHNLTLSEINEEVEEVIKSVMVTDIKRLDDKNKLEEEQNYLTKNYTYNINSPFEDQTKDNKFMDLGLAKTLDLKKVGAFKKNIPLYTIHDCFATTPNNMNLIKENVTRLFSEMYFSIPYIKKIHIRLLKLLLSKEEIFRYPIEFIREESSSNEKNDKLIIKDFKKVKVVLSKTIKIDLNYLEDPQNIKDIFDNKYYLITKDYNNPKI